MKIRQSKYLFLQPVKNIIIYNKSQDFLKIYQNFLMFYKNTLKFEQIFIKFFQHSSKHSPDSL